MYSYSRASHFRLPLGPIRIVSIVTCALIVKLCVCMSDTVLGLGSCRSIPEVVLLLSCASSELLLLVHMYTVHTLVQWDLSITNL